MSLRALSVALALLSVPSWADDLDDLDDPQSRGAFAVRRQGDAGSSARIADFLLRPDGSIEGVVWGTSGTAQVIPWNLVRLVLPDVGAADEDETTWVQAAAGQGPKAAETAPGSLGGTLGLPVVDRTGALVGIVRGALVGWQSGRIHAVSLDVVEGNDGGVRRVAVPWCEIGPRDGRGGGRALILEHDADWVRSAPGLTAPDSASAAGPGFSPRLDGRESPEPWFDPDGLR